MSDKIEDLRADWLEEVIRLKTSNSNVDELFGPNTYGSHELTDRTSLAMENWNDYILEHPACVLDFGLYQRAVEIMDLLCDFYQAASNKENEDSDV